VQSPESGRFGRGQIRLGEGRTLFVPQLPYLPVGTLASALLYPLGDEDSFSTERLTAVLEEVGLGALAGELDSAENWSQRLSQAEEQQLAFARILLAKPVLVFLDNATSTLDDPSEPQLYGLLRAASWRPAMVIASYKSTLPKFHDEVLDISGLLRTARTAAHGAKKPLTDRSFLAEAHLFEARAHLSKLQNPQRKCGAFRSACVSLSSFLIRSFQLAKPNATRTAWFSATGGEQASSFVGNVPDAKTTSAQPIDGRNRDGVRSL
jgi:hypothetical protein